MMGNPAASSRRASAVRIFPARFGMEGARARIRAWNDGLARLHAEREALTTLGDTQWPDWFNPSWQQFAGPDAPTPELAIPAARMPLHDPPAWLSDALVQDITTILNVLVTVFALFIEKIVVIFRSKSFLYPRVKAATIRQRSPNHDTTFICSIAKEL